MSINLTQEFIFETDELASLAKVMQTMFPLVLKDGHPTKYTRCFITKSECQALFYNHGVDTYDAVREPGKPNKKSSYFVCAVKNYKGDFQEELGDRYVDGFDALIEAVMAELQGFDRKVFHDECGDGFNFSFLPSDGDIVPGFRMTLDNSVWQGFNFSICHILYGK